MNTTSQTRLHCCNTARHRHEHTSAQLTRSIDTSEELTRSIDTSEQLTRSIGTSLYSTCSRYGLKSLMSFKNDADCRQICGRRAKAFGRASGLHTC